MRFARDVTMYRRVRVGYWIFESALLLSVACVIAVWSGLNEAGIWQVEALAIFLLTQSFAEIYREYVRALSDNVAPAPIFWLLRYFPPHIVIMVVLWASGLFILMEPGLLSPAYVGGAIGIENPAYLSVVIGAMHMMGGWFIGVLKPNFRLFVFLALPQFIYAFIVAIDRAEVRKFPRKVLADYFSNFALMLLCMVMFYVIDELGKKYSYLTVTFNKLAERDANATGEFE